MMVCVRCGYASPMNSAFCAACGTPFTALPAPPKKTKLWHVLLAIAFGIVGIGVIANSQSFKAQAAGSGFVAPPASAPAPARAQRDPHDAFANILHTGAFVLWEEYDANEVKADAEYKGKLIRVGGVVASIDKDFLDNVIVRLNGPKPFTDVMVYPRQSETPKASRFKKGQAINAICIGGGRIMRSPVLRDCKL